MGGSKKRTHAEITKSTADVARSPQGSKTVSKRLRLNSGETVTVVIQDAEIADLDPKLENEDVKDAVDSQPKELEVLEASNPEVEV